MFNSRMIIAALVLLTPLCGLAAEKEETKTAANADAPYVDSKITKERFKEITAEDMDLLRSKKILFASRSFGLNLCNGFRALAKGDAKYQFIVSKDDVKDDAKVTYERFDVLKAGSDLSIIPTDIFKKRNFVHFLCTYWPHTVRMEEMDTLIRKPPYEFGKQIDIAIVFFHTADPKNFDQYAEKMDAMQKDFPNVRFIYVTAGFMGPKYKDKENELAHAWSEKVRARYKGKAPLYDLGAILSDDFRVGHVYCPEYSKDPADVHPNLDEGQTMMAKGMLLLLRDTMKWKPQAGAPAAASSTAPSAVKPAGNDSNEGTVEVLAPTSPDYKAVRAILDANKSKRKVEAVSVVEKGRVVKLYLQEAGITEIPDAIGQLTELRLLHVYGDRALKLPLLTKLSPAIGKCTKLEELLLNNNDLTTLPTELTKLKNLKNLSVGDNKLGTLPKVLTDWIEKLDPKGLTTQNP